MKKSQFYASGLKFSCKRCSACCRYEAGFVYLSEIDLKKMADALKMDTQSFISFYCRWVSDWNGDEVLSLKEKSNKDCILWNDGCTVYENRPVQCVSFPFWSSIVTSKETWEMAASGCPGMNSGLMHSKEMIETKLNLRDRVPLKTRKGSKI